MANNQYVNKVEFGNNTIMDISSDTVTSDVLISGYTAHDRSGAPISGSLSTFVQSGSSAAAGLVPAPSTTAGTTAFLCEDGSWKVPVNTTYNVMTGASSSTAGTSGLVPAPSAGDEDKFLAGDGTYKSGGLPMVVLSYGNSTWNDFINAYNNHVIVYCKASSNSNPKTGTQGRMAFMAYIGFDNSGNPKDVEFQYYRSVSSHSATQMGDQVFIYKLTNTGAWSVTTREASPKEIKAGTNQKIGVSWSGNVVTLSNTMTADDMPMSSSDNTTTKSAIDTLNSNFIAKALSATLGDGIVSVDGYYIKAGNLVTINYRFSVSSNDIPAGRHLLINMNNEAMPIGALAVNGVCGIAHRNGTAEQVNIYIDTYASPYGMCLDSGGTFLANNSYRGTITFITT